MEIRNSSLLRSNEDHGSIWVDTSSFKPPWGDFDSATWWPGAALDATNVLKNRLLLGERGGGGGGGEAINANKIIGSRDPLYCIY